MGHFLEIVVQLLSSLPPFRTSAEGKSAMGRIGNFFGGLFYVVLAVVILGALAGSFLS